MPVRVLIIDDSDDDALLIVTHLRRGGIELTYERAETTQTIAEALAARPPDIVICDYNLPGLSAQDALRLLHDSGLDASFILVSGAVGEETAAAIMKAGAHDFILKDRLSRLVPAVERELADAQVRRQRHGAEAALRDSEERFRLLAEHVQDIIFRYRLVPEPGFEYISPAVADLTGLQPEELYLNPGLVFAAMEPEDRGAVEASWRSPEPSPLITRWRQGDGSIAWTEQRAVGIRDDSGQVIAVEGILRNVTSQVLADQERERMDRELRQADRLDSLGRLSGGIAHDFNNVLAVIMAYASEIASSLPSDHLARQDALKIGQAAEHAAALTRQLLIFSRLEPSQPETLNLNSVVTGIEQLLRRTIGEDIEFLTLVQEDLRPVTIDRTKIEQVIMNLVMNSRAAMPGGGQLRIETANLDPDPGLTPGADGDRPLVSLTVTDTGSGMTAEVAPARLRAVLHHQGPGPGHRPRPAHRLRRSQGGRRRHQAPVAARRRHRDHRAAAGGRTRHHPPAGYRPRRAGRRRPGHPGGRGRGRGTRRGDAHPDQSQLPGHIGRQPQGRAGDHLQPRGSHRRHADRRRHARHVGPAARGPHQGRPPASAGPAHVGLHGRSAARRASGLRRPALDPQAFQPRDPAQAPA